MSGDGAKAPRRPAASGGSGNRAAISELVSGIERQPQFARMVGYSLTCLTSMVVDEVSAEEIIESGAIEAIEAAMAMHPDNEALHRQYAAAMAALSRTARTARMVGERAKRRFDKFASSLRNHKDVETHIASARAIVALARDGDNLAAMADQGVLDALSDALKQHPHNTELQEAAAQVFAKFAAHKDECAEFLTRCGAIEVILGGMVAQPSHAGLARSGAEMLAVLSNSGRENLERLRRMGALDALLAVLDARPEDELLAMHASKALAQLSGELDVRHALAVCSGDMALTLASAKALSKLASLLLVPDNVDTMFREQGVQWLLSTLHQAADADELDEHGKQVAQAGLRALARAALDVNKSYDILRHGGAQLLVSLLNTQSDESILAASLTALMKLVADREEHALYLAAHGAINAALRAYATHPNSVEIARSALDLLSACSVFGSTHESLLQAGSADALIDMLRRHAHDARMVRDAIDTLGRLMTSEELCRSMVASGLLPLLFDALKRHMDDRDVVASALRALEAVSLLPENARELIKLGALDLIRAAMVRHAHDEEIQRLGRAALESLLAAQQAERDAMEAAERARREEAERARLAALERERAAQAAAEAERARREAEAEERERLEALQRLRAQDAAEEKARREAERARQQKEWEDNIRLRQMREKEAREQAHLASLIASAPKPVAPAPKPTFRSARALLEGDDDGPIDERHVELDPAVRQFLLAGSMLVKHSKTAAPAPKHVYLSPDCHLLIWHKPMTDLLAKNTMAVDRIYAVSRGHSTPQLQRVRFGKSLAGPPDCCFSIHGAAGDDGHQRSVDLECKTAAECEQWVDAVEQLIKWVKAKRLYGSSTVHMTKIDAVIKSAKKEQRQEAHQQH